MKMKTVGIAIVAMILLSSMVTVQVAYAASGNSTGTAHVGSNIPTITSPMLYLPPSTAKNATSINTNTEYYVNFTISDLNTLADLNNVTIRIYLDGALENGTDTLFDHFSYTWVESSATWACLNGEGYIVQDDCEDPGTAYGETSYEFRLGFKLSKVGRYTSASGLGWKISIFVWDDTATPNADADRTLFFDVNYYCEISITDVNHAWTGLYPSTSINVTVDSEPVDFTVLSNDFYNITCKGSVGGLIKGAGPDSIAYTNLVFYGNDTLALATIMTEGYLDVGDLTDKAACTDDDPAVSHGIYLWLTVPEGTMPGDYVYTLSIQILQA